MAIVKAFKGIRPIEELASKIAALPYDVMSSEEARDMVVDNPYSFLHIDRAEIDLDPSVDIHDKKVYEKARENLDKMIEDGQFIQDEKPCLYIYRQIMNGRAQTGLVFCASIDDYLNNVIKKHEYTRADKELDRINHVDYCDSNTGPIFLTYREDEVTSEVIKEWTKEGTKRKPVYDFVSEDGIGHQVWVIDNEIIVEEIIALFKEIEKLYIADGHHRIEAAARVAMENGRGHKKSDEINYFLAIAYPDTEVNVLDYNRTVKDLNGYTKEEFLKEISETWSTDSGEYRYHGKKVDAVLIDEAQFLSPEEVDTLSDIVDFYGIPVLCYGLRADFQTHLFPGSRRLMEIADIIEEVPTVCWCGRRAQCNTRYADGKIVREGAQIFLGSNESYVALCRKHYKEGKLWKEDE